MQVEGSTLTSKDTGATLLTANEDFSIQRGIMTSRDVDSAKAQPIATQEYLSYFNISDALDIKQLAQLKTIFVSR